MSFADEARSGDAWGAVRAGLVNGALWAIALSWSRSIREITLALLPQDTADVVFGELLAAVVTTALGVGVAIVAARNDCQSSCLRLCRGMRETKGAEEEDKRASQLAPTRGR